MKLIIKNSARFNLTNRTQSTTYSLIVAVQDIKDPNSKEERFNRTVALFILDSLLDGDKQPESDGGSDQGDDSAVLRFVVSCNLVGFFDRSFGFL